MTAAEKRKVIADIFESAHNVDGIEFLYLMLRVRGLELDTSDRILRLLQRLTAEKKVSVADMTESTAQMAADDVLELLGNLLRLIGLRRYTVVPFFSLKEGLGRSPSVDDKIRFLIRKAAEVGKVEFAELLKQAYVSVLENARSIQPKDSEVRKAYKACRSFTVALLKEHARQKLKFRGQPEFIKIPGYQIFELLVDKKTGLYGFYDHYPSGGKSYFIRHPDDVDSANFMLDSDGGIQPFVGLIPFEKEWLVKGKRLHELALEGRYNTFGEWRPILYPADPTTLVNEARSLSQDFDIQGTAFYILATGYKGIEFVVKANIDLPYQNGNIDDQIHLWKCPITAEDDASQNIRLYDGWVKLDSPDPEGIKKALIIIGIALNRLAFAYDGHLEWRVKYKLSEKARSLLVPPVEEMEIFNHFLMGLPKGKDSGILDIGFDWYNRARIANNLFASFICYYIVIEAVASFIVKGHGDFGLQYKKETKAERALRLNECIQSKLEELYEVNRREFVETAYFDCVQSLTESTKTVAKLVLGDSNPFVDQLFKRSGPERKSLHQIRSDIAHGSLSLVDKNDELLVAKRLPEIARISREFLLRLSYSLRPEAALRPSSIAFTSHQTFADPRNTLYVQSPHDVLMGADWKIRAEWVA